MGLDAANRVAFAALEEIYREGWHWEKLIELLLARAPITRRASRRRVELLQDVAKIYEEQMGQPEAGLRGAPGGLQAGLHQRHHGQEPRAAGLAPPASGTSCSPSTARWSRQSPSPRSRPTCWSRWGAGTATSWATWTTPSPRCSRRCRSTRSACGRYERWPTFFRKTARWAELVQVLDRQAELEEDPEKRVELYGNMAELFETQIADPSQAIAAYRKALDVDEINADALDSARAAVPQLPAVGAADRDPRAARPRTPRTPSRSST